MAKKKSATSTADRLKKQLAQYEHVFDEITRFLELICSQEEEVIAATGRRAEAKERFDAADRELKDARESRDGTKHALFMFLKPGPAEILPLFDRMEPADNKKHGARSSVWRKEPISALRLSLIATNLLTAADVMFVGQLQDRVQKSPELWWEEIEGLTAPTAAAIADKLAAFIKEKTGK